MTVNFSGLLGIHNPNELKKLPFGNIGTCDGPDQGGIAGKTKLPFPFGSCDGPDKGGIMGKIDNPLPFVILEENPDKPKQSLLNVLFDA